MKEIHLNDDLNNLILTYEAFGVNPPSFQHHNKHLLFSFRYNVGLLCRIISFCDNVKGRFPAVLGNSGVGPIGIESSTPQSGVKRSITGAIHTHSSSSRCNPPRFCIVFCSTFFQCISFFSFGRSVHSKDFYHQYNEKNFFYQTSLVIFKHFHQYSVASCSLSSRCHCFDVIIKAQTASITRLTEPPLSYLNQGKLIVTLSRALLAIGYLQP